MYILISPAYVSNVGKNSEKNVNIRPALFPNSFRIKEYPKIDIKISGMQENKRTHTILLFVISITILIII